MCFFTPSMWHSISLTGRWCGRRTRAGAGRERTRRAGAAASGPGHRPEGLPQDHDGADGAAPHGALPGRPGVDCPLRAAGAAQAGADARRAGRRPARGRAAQHV